MSGVIRAVFGMGITGDLSAGIVMHMVWCNRGDTTAVSIVVGGFFDVVTEKAHPAARTRVAENLAACALLDVCHDRAGVVIVVLHVEYTTPPPPG